MISHEYTGKIATDAGGKQIDAVRIYRVTGHDLDPAPVTSSGWANALTAHMVSGDCVEPCEGSTLVRSAAHCRFAGDVVEFVIGPRELTCFAHDWAGPSS